jgi:hypothetical protein
MPKGQSIEARRARFAHGRCPIHGAQMTQDSGWYYPQGERPYTIEKCCWRTCEIRAKAFDPYVRRDDLELLPEYAHLLTLPGIPAVPALQSPQQQGQQVNKYSDEEQGLLWQTASKSYLQKWGVKAPLLDRITPYKSIPRFLWHESFILLLHRMVAHQNALQRVRSA